MSDTSYITDIIRDIGGWLDRPVVVTGLMGAGKTRIGRGLADRLALEFVDSDDEIEKAAGLAISEIFEKFGEAHFRDGERRVISRLIGGGVRVIGTGGGAVMTPETADLIREKAVSLWVRAELPVMLERTSRNNKRPLLQQGNPEEILKKLMERRYPVYEKADIVVESHDGPVADILNDALERLHAFLKKD